MGIHPYLLFDGCCEEAINRYREILGGEIKALMKMSDAPKDANMPADCGNGVLHACLETRGMMIMASDCPSQYFKQMQGMHLHLMTKELAEAEKIFVALGEGGTVMMPLEQNFWAKGYGSLVDRFGTPWMVSCPLEPPAK